MKQTTKPVTDIKKEHPYLIHKYSNDIHYVGVVTDEGKGFMIKGSGFSYLDAWNDAWNWINKTGRYKATYELEMF
jgi:hypothetical protein